MATLLQQETQIRASLTADRDDTVTPSEANFETNAVSLLDDINNICSAISNLYDGQAGDWFIDLNTPSTLESGTQRGVNDLNTALHAVEKKRVLRDVHKIDSIAVGGSDNWVVLALSELPANTTAAVGTVTTLGTVAAFHSGTFGTHALDEVAGGNALSPDNLCIIVEAASRDPILSGGRQVYGLFQTETATDGHTMTGTTTTRAQLSFVRQNSAGSDLEACPAADIQGQNISYSSRERVRLEDLNEADFLRGAIVDVGSGSGTVTRQAAYTNQGTTAVDVVTNSILDLEGAGLTWEIRDDLEASLFKVTEGSAGGTSEVALGSDVDTFNNDAAVNDFAAGATIRSGGSNPIQVGITDGEIGTSAGDLTLDPAGELILNDVNMTGEATWTGPGVKVTETQAEVTAYETAFGGEVSLFNAIVQAKNTSGRRRVFSAATANVAADTDVSGPANDNNLDTNLGDLSNGTFISDYDVFHNGQYLKLDAADAGTGDVYPGTSLANGQLKFNRKIKSGDMLCVIDYAN